ncbi:MAG: hypothetical protein APR54_10390 [Candidatus Cloacimonas sp. SDB]|nr:MAG: hypothetical protein APR54_10390 [Candidatus Cloacimonas sp. SDB]
MKTLKGLYLEEVEFVLENMQRNSQITVKKETSNNNSFSVTFESEDLYKKIEDLLYYNQKDNEYENEYRSKYNSFDDDFDEE